MEEWGERRELIVLFKEPVKSYLLFNQQTNNRGSVRQGSPEEKNQEEEIDRYSYIGISFEELVHIIMETEKSYSLLSERVES